MIHKHEFEEAGKIVLEWIDHYYQNLKSYPVKSNITPGQIIRDILPTMPLKGVDMQTILDEIDSKLMKGITHWQSPNFHAYFPANSSYESVLAEFITAAIGAQCMIWETSPAAAELEEKVLGWIQEKMTIPANFEGVIQDTASSATLTAIITAREKSTNFKSNEEGVPNNLRVYCSSQAHSSVEKAVKIAGIGRKNLVKIFVDDHLRMIPGQLEVQINRDIKEGHIPSCVVVAIGTTSTLAIDQLGEIGQICSKYGVWLHVDAAYAGIAALLPEYKWIFNGLETADSIVINAHKWLFTNFDCSLYYVKDAETLIKTFEILPEYLKTKTRGMVNDYRDWGIPLGRRFRALKLWFLIKSWGLQGIQERLREHIELTKYAQHKIESHPEFEIMVPSVLNYFAFRYHPKHKSDQQNLNDINSQLLDLVNDSGKMFATHTKINEAYVIRLVFGQTYLTRQDVDRSLETIFKATSLLHNPND